MEPAAVYRRHIPEDRLDGKPLGRHVHHDPRSREYPAEKASQVVSVVHQVQGLPLDQGAVGSCTGEALTGAGNAQPNLKAGVKPRTQDDAYAVYHSETVLEGDPYPPNDPGGSGLMVCRAGRQLGWLTSYRHAFGLEHALLALVKRPAIFGVDWYQGFDSPDKEGIVRISGSVRGGHEVCALRIDAERSLVGFAQSWGEGWGVADAGMGLPKGGAFYVPFEDLDRLLQAQGDVVVPYFAYMRAEGDLSRR